jgi:catechol 2,3-dioxygenase-like lactoylglutathione lyase family enzyme
VTVVWYRVRDLDAARAFYTGTLGFEERYVDLESRWARLEWNGTEVALAEGEPEEGGVALIDVVDAKLEAERLREAGAHVGVVLELHAAMRIVDVFDPDGNRLQLAEEVS